MEARFNGSTYTIGDLNLLPGDARQLGEAASWRRGDVVAVELSEPSTEVPTKRERAVVSEVLWRDAVRVTLVDDPTLAIKASSVALVTKPQPYLSPRSRPRSRP